MPQVYPNSASPIQIPFKSKPLAFAKKHKKKALPLALTSLLAACDSDGNPVPSDESLLAQGYNIYHSPIFSNDTYYGTFGNDAIIGESGDDTFYGSFGDDLIYGQGGDDIIHGDSGGDEIYGGSGDDFISPGVDLNYDYINGGSGNDTVSYINHTGNLNINLTSGEVYINSSFEDDLENIENVDGAQNASNIIYGNAADNLLSGGNLGDTLYGLAGDDTLEGQGGNDELYGGSGNDELYGDAGDDILVGGVGSDELTGGTGDDEFKFSDADIVGAISFDTIKDFNVNDDYIDFSDLSYINNFTDVLNNMVQDGANVIIDLDVAGDHDVTLENMNINNLAAIDFIFV